MADKDVLIDRTQAVTWAQEATLQDLVSSVGSTNRILNTYIKATGKVDAETQQALEQLATVVRQSGDRTVRATEGVKPKLDKSLSDAFKDLESEVSRGMYSLRGMFMGRTDLAGTLQDFSIKSTAAGKGLWQLSHELPATHGALLKLGAGFVAYAGIAMGLLGVMTSLSDEFGKLYANGINLNGGLTGLTTYASELGLSVSAATRVLTEYSNVVTYLGTDRTKALIKTFKDLNSGGAAFHMSQSEAARAMLEYADLMRDSGAMRTMDDKEAAAAANRYQVELTAASVAQGRNRQELEKTIKSLMKSDEGVARMRLLPAEMQKNMPIILGQLQRLGAGGEMLGKGMVDMLAGGVGMMDENLRQALQMGGGFDVFRQMADTVRSGGTDIGSAMDEMIPRLEKAVTSEGMQRLALAGNQGAQALIKMTKDMTAYRESREKEKADMDKFAIDYKKKTGETLTQEALRTKFYESKATDEKRAAERMKEAVNVMNNLFQTLAIDIIKPLLPVFEGLANIVSAVAKAIGGFAEAVKNAVSSIAGDGVGSAAGAAAGAGLLYGGYKVATGVVGRFRGRGASPVTTPGISSVGRTAGPMGAAGTAMEMLSGAGPGVGATMKGLAAGFEAFKSPTILIGAGIFSASVAMVVTGLGAGIAAAAFLIGKTLPTLSEGMKAFEQVDGEKLSSAAGGITKLSGALVLFGGANVINAFGAIGSAIMSFFGQDPLTKLRGFAEIGEPLEKAGNSMQQFSDVYPRAMAAINTARFDPTGLTSLERLRTLFAGEGFFASLGKGIANMLGQGDFMTQLSRFADSSEKISNLSKSLTTFSESYIRLADAMSRGIPLETINQMQKVVDLASRLNERSSLFAGLFRGREAPATAGAAGAPVPTPETAQENVNKKALEFYKSTDSKNDMMLEMLSKINEQLVLVERANRDSSVDISRSIERINPDLMRR